MQKTHLTHILFSGLVCSALLFSGHTSAADEVTDAVKYTPQGWLAKSLPELSVALQSGKLTSEALVADYLLRIKQIDKTGPTLQSILMLNPDALVEARTLDARRKAGENLGPLHGIPVLLKDNIETKDAMATTAGALALEDNVTGRD